MEYARILKLDVNRFRACLDSGKFRQQVQTDYEEGMRAGVAGTPTFFINGVVMSGAQPLDEFKTVIDRELGAATAQNVKSK